MTFEELYRRHAPEVFRLALRLSGNRADADDITSETFVRAWTAAGGLRGQTVRAYLLTIAVNLHRRHRRRQWRDTALENAHPAPEPSPEDAASHRVRLGRVEADLRTLSAPDRAALLLRAVHGLSYAEVGGALGCTPGAARVRVHRVREALNAPEDVDDE